jgi:aminoglycoside 3-N-acetyltransferase
MLTFRDFVIALRKLELDRSRPVIAHASLSAFGEVHGGAETMLGALLSTCNTVIMPAFTFKTMLIPEVGPEDNALVYGSGVDSNRMAEFFRPDIPVDPLVGSVSETLRRHPKAHRSMHPILSFAGLNTDQALDAQTVEEPLSPIRELHEGQGWVLLIGVDHTVDTSIHYAERLAGRKQFVRWALTTKGVVECPGFPGCSDGFQAVAPRLEGVTRRVQAGPAEIQAVPLSDLVDTVRSMIVEDPLALLCSRESCERCDVVRATVN